MRKRRYIFPLLFTHICIIVFHSPVYVYYASRVFFEAPSSPHSLSFHESFDPENFEKRHTSHRQRKRKETNRDRHFFVVVRYVSIYYVIHTRARVFVSLFDINERAIAFILSSLARSARARSLRFHRSERVGKIIIFTLVLCARVLRAPKKKVHPKLSSASRDPSFFITTTRFQKSGSLFGSMTERERERDYLHLSSQKKCDRSIDRSFASRVFLFRSQTLFISTTLKNRHLLSVRSHALIKPRASFYSKKRVFE